MLCLLAADTNRWDQLPADQADNKLSTRARAAENEQFIVFVNHAKRFNGGSYIIGPAGEVIMQMGSARPRWTTCPLCVPCLHLTSRNGAQEGTRTLTPFGTGF